MKWMTASIGATLLFAGMAMSTLLAQQQSSPQSQPAFQTSESEIRRGTVQDIDYKNRTVTIKGERGNVVTIQVGDEAKNFNNIKKGDTVTAHYRELMAVTIHKAGQAPTASQQETLTTAPPGQKPAGTQTRKTEISATVVDIDRENRGVTLRGPEGNTRKLKVGQSVEGFDNLKVGDQVLATYTEEFTIAVSPPHE